MPGKKSKSSKSGSAQANFWTIMIPQMQQKADRVEQNILRAEELLAVDAENDKKELPFQHQDEVSKLLTEAEGLLKDLFLDIGKIKKLNHPGCKEIERDVCSLHERWLKDCLFYRDIYEQLDDVSLMPYIDWEKVFCEKQKLVDDDTFGPSCAELEKQIACQNIQHKELESYNSQLNVNSAGSKEKCMALRKKYNPLLESSKWRCYKLKSVHEYMQACNKELAFLRDEGEKIKKQDWSDHMADPADVRRQYENFKNNSLLSHEKEVNTLQDRGDKLVELARPASEMIQNQRDAVREEWQKFLNLCICQETHLDNVEEWKKYQMDTEQLSESLSKLNNTLDPKSLSKRSNYETRLKLECEKETVENCEQWLSDLRKRSTTICPLKLRRVFPSRPTTVESLCDWETDKDSLSRGEKCTLKSNSGDDWDVIDSGGSTKSFPGVCFQIPPPDPEAIDNVDILGQELADVKKRRADLASSLKNRKVEVARSQQSAPVSSDPLDPKLTELGLQLDKMFSDLDSAEEGMLSRMRTPVDSNNPDAELKKQGEAVDDLKALKQQMEAADADLQSLLAKDPSGASSGLPLKLSAANNKLDSLYGLADLYKKKQNASLNLENQIKKVDGIVSKFEKSLSEDGPINDVPNALQARADDIQYQEKAVTAAQDDMKKLGQDLEATEKLCSSLQQSYQEYCPDINRQRKDVKDLQNRYANVENQLKDRENLLRDAAVKNQEFQSTSKSLNSFLDNLPSNQINPSDDLSQITSKQSAQERLMEDLKRKESDMDRVSDLSQDMQNLLNEYESNVERYDGVLEAGGATIPKKPRLLTLADTIQKEEKDLLNRYAEATAENSQRQKQMGLANNLLLQNEEKVQMVAQQQVQLENQQRCAEKVGNILLRERDDLREYNHQIETNLRVYKSRLLSLENRRGVERIEETEVLQYCRDPKLECDLTDLKKKIDEEKTKQCTIRSEVDGIKRNIKILEDNHKNTPPKLATREVTEFERDPQLDIEAAKYRDEIARVRDENRVKDVEQNQMKTEYASLQKKRQPIKEKVVKKEVVKVEKNPEMLKSVPILEMEISDESNKSKLINDEIFQTRHEINALERLIPNIQPKIITKEVRQVEQDPELINESKRIHTSLEEERIEYESVCKELMGLQNRYREVTGWEQKIEVKEIVNELYQIDQNTELEIMRLRKDIQDSRKGCTDLERAISQVTSDLEIVRSEKPKVEMREVLQEVVKEERSPEKEREIQTLNDKVCCLQTRCNSLQDKVKTLRKERDDWKAEKSKIETKLVNREVIKYECDPLQEKEADHLRKVVREEAQVRRSIEEMVFDLQNKYIVLERQKPEEKVVVQEVVRMQKDPRQMMEHERLSRNLDEQVMTRRQLELEIQQVRTKVEVCLRTLTDSDEGPKRMTVESELRETRLRITQLENAPPPIEESIIVVEILKVERDTKLERLICASREEFDKETSNILRIERERRNIMLKIDILRREKSGEKTVYKEVVRVEKDPAIEAERERLRDQVSQEKFARQDLEDKIRRLNDKITYLSHSKSSTSREETTITLNRDALQRENENRTRELRTLMTTKQDVSLAFQQQSRLASEKTQMSRQKSTKLELDIQRLERDILNEKDKIHQRDSTIRDLLMNLQKEENTETRTKETNVSTKITILDPETGRDMSPYDAYMKCMIDRPQYLQLQELECDWEETTSIGPDGETSVLQDRKSGKQYSIKNALKEGRLTEYQLQQYREGKIPISEFALLVAGEHKKQPTYNSVITHSSTTIKSSTLNSSPYSSNSPVAGIIDTNTDTCYTIRSAAMRKLIEPVTAQKLLEAQAATGGIIDIQNGKTYPVNKASGRGLVDESQVQRLLNAQKAYNGVTDPMTGELLSVGEAVQRGWMPKDNVSRFMEVQHLTGGLVDPSTGKRVSITEAIGSKMIDSTMMRELQAESTYIKDIVDPVTNNRINYKQALDRCKIDPVYGLPVLPAKYARF